MLKYGRLLVLLAASGCAGLPVYQENPATVGGNMDLVWNKTIEVVDRYFDIAYENRYDGRIRTLPQAGASLFEPWLADSTDFSERLEATLQTVRRRCFVLVQPAPNGGWLISVEVYKELEDLPRPVSAGFGGGTFIPSIQPVRESLVTSAIKPSAGWISLGRDQKLEAVMLDEIQTAVNFSL